MAQKLVTLYIPEDLYSIIKQKATEEDRSINNYINRILKLQTGTTTPTTPTTRPRREGDLW